MGSFQPILEKPVADFERLMAVLSGKKPAERVHPIELLIDEEILEAISEGYLHEKWIKLSQSSMAQHYRQKAALYHKLGYDGLVEGVWRTDWLEHPPLGSPTAQDTAAEHSRGARDWAREGLGIIGSRKDFEAFPWDKIGVDYRKYDILNTCLPEGMKVYAATALFEHVLENLLGFEGLFYKLTDDPELVGAVFERWGAICLRYYENVIDYECVGAIWHTDDLGYNNGTILSPEHLKKYVFPWLARYAKIAHDHHKLFVLHSCGNYYSNGQIEEVIAAGVDVVHAFQEVIFPIPQAMAKYGKRIGLAGGVDMDHLCRLDEAAFRKYLRNILGNCASGRFALGSGNTIANYVPLKNYFIMLEEGRNWS